MCHYAECRALSVLMLNVVMPSVVMLNVVMLNVGMLSVAEPYLVPFIDMIVLSFLRNLI